METKYDSYFKKLRASFGGISKLKYNLNVENLIQIYYSLIESHLRFGIMVWHHENKMLIQKIQQY